jgi:hypothetical protein
MSLLVKAINKLRPNSEFSFQDDDYATINWIVLNGEPPTQDEIDIAVEEVKAAQEADLAETKAKRKVLLDRLGITDEEVKLLLA